MERLGPGAIFLFSLPPRPVKEQTKHIAGSVVSNLGANEEDCSFTRGRGAPAGDDLPVSPAGRCKATGTNTEALPDSHRDLDPHARSDRDIDSDGGTDRDSTAHCNVGSHGGPDGGSDADLASGSHANRDFTADADPRHDSDTDTVIHPDSGSEPERVADGNSAGFDIRGLDRTV
jgi:hypothetical protein